MAYRFEFTNLQTGKSCCKSNDIRHLCASCSVRARGVSAPAPAPAVAPVVAAAVEEPPAPPSLVDSIRAKHGAAPIPMTPSYVGPGPGPTVAAAGEQIDAPPDLIDAIRSGRTR